MTMFQKAQRTQRPFKLSITGPSGSGKTWSALTLAHGLADGGNVALIDTENASASMYSDRFNFDTAVIDAPYTPQKYLDAITAAENAGYKIIVIDSLSHAWAGEGGILDRKAAVDSRGGNSFSNWQQFTKEQERLFSKIVNSKIDMIVTMRSKQEYILQENDKGRMIPKKVGMAPVQRKDSEFEFDVVYNLAMDHTYEISKDRTGLFDGKIEKISEATALALLKWRKGGAPIFHNDAPPAPETPPSEKPTKALSEIEKLGESE